MTRPANSRHSPSCNPDYSPTHSALRLELSPPETKPPPAHLQFWHRQESIFDDLRRYGGGIIIENANHPFGIRVLNILRAIFMNPETRDTHRHVGLSRAKPDLTHENVFDHQGIFPFDRHRSIKTDREFVQLHLPFPRSIALRSFRLLANGHGDPLSRLGSAHPQIGASESACKTMWSEIMLGRLTSAQVKSDVGNACPSCHAIRGCQSGIDVKTGQGHRYT